MVPTAQRRRRKGIMTDGDRRVGVRCSVICTGYPRPSFRRTSSWLGRLAPRKYQGSIGRSAGRGLAKANKRREMLIRIAQCEYAWPDEVMEDGVIDEDEVEDVQMVSVVGEGLKNVVRRLLVRDPLKRTRLVELWDQEEWMCGGGRACAPRVFLACSAGLAKWVCGRA